MKQFLRQIKKFNEMYKIPMSDKPSLPTVEDLQRFKSILQEELLEIDQIIQVIGRFEDDNSLLDIDNETPSHIMADLADWHGDMIIYCHTHAAKFGLPMDEILDVIMESNFSKLGADGKPIYDERGKVLKGPNFFPPEPALNKLLKAKNEE